MKRDAGLRPFRGAGSGGKIDGRGTAVFFVVYFLENASLCLVFLLTTRRQRHGGAHPSFRAAFTLTGL